MKVNEDECSLKNSTLKDSPFKGLLTENLNVNSSYNMVS